MKIHMIRRLGAKAKQAGFTAVELIVVLIVGLGILALSSGKIEMLFGGSSVVEEVSNISTIFANTKSLKTTSGYGTAGTDLTSQLVAVNGVPKNVSVVSGVIYNDWGGAIVPTSTGVGTAISSAAYPSDVCIKLATKMGKSGSFASIKINANTAIVGEVTSAVAATQCSGATNTLVYTSAS